MRKEKVKVSYHLRERKGRQGKYKNNFNLFEEFQAYLNSRKFQNATWF